MKEFIVAMLKIVMEKHEHSQLFILKVSLHEITKIFFFCPFPSSHRLGYILKLLNFIQQLVECFVGPTEKLEKKVVEGQAPRFIIPLQDTTVYIGSTIDLECKVAGDPMPTVKW